jgi:hypothetical protein
MIAIASPNRPDLANVSISLLQWSFPNRREKDLANDDLSLERMVITGKGDY